MKKIIKQFSIFFIIGCSAVAIDFYIYNVILDLLSQNGDGIVTFSKRFMSITHADIAKAIGFMCGSFYTYYMNKRFTWKQRDRNNRRLARFFTLYAISFLVNIFGNKWALGWSQIVPYVKVKDMAFLIATGMSVAINFTGQKLWVFNSNVSIIRKIKKSVFLS